MKDQLKTILENRCIKIIEHFDSLIEDEQITLLLKIDEGAKTTAAVAAAGAAAGASAVAGGIRLGSEVYSKTDGIPSLSSFMKYMQVGGTAGAVIAILGSAVVGYSIVKLIKYITDSKRQLGISQAKLSDKTMSPAKKKKLTAKIKLLKAKIQAANKVKAARVAYEKEKLKAKYAKKKKALTKKK